MALREVFKAFFTLSPKQQKDFLRDLYNYSPDIKIFVESKLGLQTDFQKYLTEMHRETVDKIYRKGTPGTPNGRTVNSIITKAQKAQAPLAIMLELEQLAFRGFIEFLNQLVVALTVLTTLPVSICKIISCLSNSISRIRKSDKNCLKRSDGIYRKRIICIPILLMKPLKR